MAQPTSTPFQAMEDEAYHAFREWPLFLVMRQKELAQHLAAVSPSAAPPDPAEAALAVSNPVKEEEQPQNE
jgi:hypothetical protein